MDWVNKSCRPCGLFLESKRRGMVADGEGREGGLAYHTRVGKVVRSDFFFARGHGWGEALPQRGPQSEVPYLSCHLLACCFSFSPACRRRRGESTGQGESWGWGRRVRQGGFHRRGPVGSRARRLGIGGFPPWPNPRGAPRALTRCPRGHGGAHARLLKRAEQQCEAALCCGPRSSSGPS